MAPGRPCAEAEIAARRLALRHQAALEPLGTSPDASTLQHGPSFGAVGTVYHVARRFGIAQALGTTRAGQLALWHVSARGIAPGSRLAAGRLALAHAACDGLGCGTFAADALEAHLDGLAGAQARRAARLCAPRPKTQPARRLVSAGTRSSLDGPPHALAAFGSHRAGHTGTLQRGLG
jgi:hypothetical protein